MSVAPFGTSEDSRKGQYGSLTRAIRQSDKTAGPTLHQMLAVLHTVVCQWKEKSIEPCALITVIFVQAFGLIIAKKKTRPVIFV